MVEIVGSVDRPDRPTGHPSKFETGDVHIWCVDVERNGSLDDRCLDRQEREQVDRFHFARHANAYRCAHVMRRSVLGGYRGVQPDELRYETGIHGRPQLSAYEGTVSEIRFNATSSLPVSLLAVTVNCQVGIDVERLRPMPDAAQIAETQFHPDEAEIITGLGSAADRHDAFFRCWTRKEAVVKALGTGLSTDIATFVVGAGPEDGVFHPRFLNQPQGIENLWLLDLSRPPTYCTLALSCQPKQVWIGSWSS